MSDKKLFSKAELDHIEKLAAAANHAMAAYRGFLVFLREQHDAPEQDGWNLDERGFGKQAPAQSTSDRPNGGTSNGKHDDVDEQVSALMRQ